MIYGPLNVPAMMPVHASEMYAKNLFNFLALIVHDGEIRPDWNDEIIAASVLTRDGAILHEPARQRDRRRPVMIAGMTALYIFMLAAFTGYEIISRVPVILHTPLMSGSNFVHGIVLVGAMVALGHAHSPLEQLIGFLGVMLAAGNAVGGYVVTERMLEMFKRSKPGAR